MPLAVFWASNNVPVLANNLRAQPHCSPDTSALNVWDTRHTTSLAYWEALYIHGRYLHHSEHHLFLAVLRPLTFEQESARGAEHLKVRSPNALCLNFSHNRNSIVLYIQLTQKSLKVLAANRQRIYLRIIHYCIVFLFCFLRSGTYF